MNVSNLYRKIKQILTDSNTALVNKGYNEVSSLTDISSEIEKLEINRLPYLLRKEISEITEDDLEGCTRIAEYALYGYNNIKNISIPDSVTSIGAKAFVSTDCRDNENYWENNDIYNSVFYIGKHLIEGHMSGDYTIKDGTIVIADEAFYNRHNLTNITIPNSVVNIGKQAFASCNGFTNITIPNSVVNIGEQAFSNCKNLENITINNDVTITINKNAFISCNNLKRVYAKSIESWLKIKFIDFGSTPFSYYNYNNADLYFDNQLATNIIIPSSITSIGDFAFLFCKCLTSVVIPNSVTSIGDRAFAGCTNLTDIYLYSITPPTLYATNSIPGTTTIHVPIGSSEAYKTATNWSSYSRRIVEDIEIIE